jgi:hypothetical protein
LHTAGAILYGASASLLGNADLHLSTAIDLHAGRRLVRRAVLLDQRQKRDVRIRVTLRRST